MPDGSLSSAGSLSSLSASSCSASIETQWNFCACDLIDYSEESDMLLSVAAMALVLQGTPAIVSGNHTSLLQQSRYRRDGHPPPCGHGWDVDERDGMCYRTGSVPPQFQAGRYYPLKYGGRHPVQCGHGADVDIRDGFCYPTGTVPRRFQEGRRSSR